MAIIGADSFREVIYQYNAPYRSVSCGFSEVRHMVDSGDIVADRAIALTLGQLRLRCLPEAFTMVRGVTKTTARRGRARKVMGPVSGVYPPETRNEFSETSISIAPASPAPTGVDNTNVVVETEDFFKVDQPSVTARFRVEGELDVSLTYHMHGVPDVFMAELRELDVAENIEWWDSAATTDPTVKVASGNYWENFKDYFTFLKRHFKIVKPWEDTGTGNTTPKAFNLHPIDGIFFECISKHDVGEPFGLPRGRAMMS